MRARDGRVDDLVIVGRSHGSLRLGLEPGNGLFLLLLRILLLLLLIQLLVRVELGLCVHCVFWLSRALVLLLLVARRAAARARSRFLR
jgi:hypothetical protein